MRRALLLALGLPSLFLLASCGESFDPSGSYRGLANISSTITSPGEDGDPRRVSSSTGVSGVVQVREAGEEALEVVLTNGCTLRFSRTDPHNATVLLSPAQVCVLREGRFEGPFQFTGHASMVNDRELGLLLTATVTQPNPASGSLSYQFNGQRQ